ncbi:MAG: EF2563 family selenium-dependent molybdenum hydroxylase system protein [Betaproteobacteria bacterium]|nr:EF2563 family selenium-dependent molybdenum hydroxylase system protein [Betaproteobacteria bacterium]
MRDRQPAARRRQGEARRPRGVNAGVSPFVLLKGAGEMASAVAWRLYMANMRRICMLDLERPLCVRRRVSFCVALQAGETNVEDVRAQAARNRREMEAAWKRDAIAVMLTTDWTRLRGAAPDVLVDAILAKRNTGTRIEDAPLVIALGPGFDAGVDCHLVIETNRGHDLGRVIAEGCAAPNTGRPGDIAGYTAERVLRSPAAGMFISPLDIGHRVRKGDIVGRVGEMPVAAAIDGVLRGLIGSHTEVRAGMKLGDVDPRGRVEDCDSISDKARAIAGAVLEGILRHYNRPRVPARC